MTVGNQVITCAVFRRTLWELNGGYFDTGTGRDHVAEDWDFWLRLAAGGARIRNIAGEHLFNYRIHPGASLSSASDVKSLSDQRRQILDRNKNLLTPQAIARSSREAARRWAAAPPGAQLFNANDMAADSRRSLLLAVPYLVVGGAERLLASVVRFLTAQGWRVTLIATLPQPRGSDTSNWFTAHTREVYMLPRFLNNWQYEHFVFYLLANRKFDALLLAGSRLIYDLLPRIEELYPALAIVDLLFNTQGHVVSHLKHRARITLAIGENPEVINWYRAQHWSADRVRLIESGVDLARFRASRPPELARRLGVRPDDVVVGFSGRLSTEKAPEVFLKIAVALRDEPRVRFVMTGSGPLAEWIRSQVKTLPAGTRLDFLGLVDDVSDYFSLYDIFVLPSRVDGRPMALLEALASGCAVVASSVGGVPALIEGAGAGVLCSPDDVVAFAAAVRAIARDPERLNQLKRRALAAAERLLSERQTGQAYLEALEAAIAIKRACDVPAKAVAG
jgi:glycosyltransferase involved in cell wall biosynthesis